MSDTSDEVGTDCLGNEIRAGDIVAVSVYKSSGLKLGRIKKPTASGASMWIGTSVRVGTPGRHERASNKTRETFVKIEPETIALLAFQGKITVPPME